MHLTLRSVDPGDFVGGLQHCPFLTREETEAQRGPSSEGQSWD